MFAAGCESDTFLLRLHELAKPPRRTHTDGDGIGFGLMVVGDPRTGGKFGGLVADGHDLVDRDGLGQRLARRLIASEWKSRWCSQREPGAWNHFACSRGSGGGPGRAVRWDASPRTARSDGLRGGLLLALRCSFRCRLFASRGRF